MSTEDQVSNLTAETQNQAAEVAEVAAGQSDQHDEHQGEKTEQADAQQDPRDKALAKLHRRIDRRTGEVHQLRAEKAMLQTELERFRASQGNDQASAADGRSEQGSDEQRARAIAEDLRYRDKIAERAKAMLSAGDAYEGFRDLSIEVSEEIPFIDERGRPTAFIEAVLDAENPAALMHRLGSNPDLVAELAGLSQVQQLRKLGRIEAEIAKQPEKKISNAPRPLKPVSGSQLGEPDPAKDASAWIAMRNKQARSR